MRATRSYPLPPPPPRLPVNDTPDQAKAIRHPDANNLDPEAFRSRFPTERIWHIHELLAASRYPSADQLARHFEVSTRTIKRDLEYMRDHFSLPIEFDFSRAGYFYTRSVRRFPGASVLSEADVFGILIARKALAQYQGLPFVQSLEATFRKLCGLLDDQPRYSMPGLCELLSFHPLGTDDSDAAVMDVVARALTESRPLQFVYRKPGQKSGAERRVYPYHLACIDNRWYLLGHDVERDAMRKFLLTRVNQPKLTLGRFTRPADFNPAQHLRSAFGVMTGSDDFEVVVEFDPWATDIMRGQRWHASQQVTELPAGGSRLRLRLSCLHEVARWVLSWGRHAAVISPEALIRRVAEEVELMSARYAEACKPK